MTREGLEELLRQRVGLDVSTIGAGSMDRVLARRIKETACKNIDEYFSLASRNKDEFQELTMELTIPETWFFRDRDSFVHLRTFVETIWQPGRHDQPLRILSVPCATGEEPYSIAMTLLEAGLSRGDFHIDGVDINSECLALARNGIFRPKSFRGTDLAFRSTYFSRNIEDKTFTLSPDILDTVTFSQANILSVSFPFERAAYDVIFCRNLLIYMDGESRVRVWEAITRLLAEGGIVFIGPAETAEFPGYAKIFPGYSFAFQRTGNDIEKKSSVVMQALEIKSQPARSIQNDNEKSFAAAFTPQVETETNTLPQENSTEEPVTLDYVRGLADMGKHDLAIESCQKFLSQNGPTAEAYFVLGMILQEIGEPSQAEASYHKALYLDSSHEQALINLVLLAEISGDTELAENLKSRLQRLRKRKLESAGL